MFNRVVGGVGIGIVMVLSIWLYSMFNGNILLKWMARVHVEQFLQENYEKEPFAIQEGTYNFKDGVYVFTVKQLNEQQEYAVSMNPLGKRYYDGIRTSRLDLNQMNILNEEGSQRLTSWFKDEIEELIEVNVYVEFVQGEVAAGTKFSPKFTKRFPIEGMFTLDASRMTSKEFEEVCQRIQYMIGKEGYGFKEIVIDGIVVAGTETKDGVMDHTYQKYSGKFVKSDGKIMIEKDVNVKKELGE